MSVQLSRNLHQENVDNFSSEALPSSSSDFAAATHTQTLLQPYFASLNRHPDFKYSFTPLSPNTACSPAVESALLAKYGLNSLEMTTLRLYLGLPMNVEKINRQAAGQPLHIRKNDENQLPRSFVFIPAQDNLPAQVFVLLKDHHIEPLGEGAFKTATKALGFVLQQGALVGPLKEKAFLSCKAEHAHQELIAMQKLKGLPHCLTSQAIVKYDDKTAKTLKKNGHLKKVGMIMDLMESDLTGFCAASASTAPKHADLKRLQLLGDVAMGLQEMHRLNFVHNDVKPDNMAVYKEKGKIADFGLSGPKGQRPAVLAVLNPPEVHMHPRKKVNYAPQVDIFQFGLSMMAVCGYEKYVTEYVQTIHKCYEEDTYLSYLPRFVENIFYRFKSENTGPLVQLISDCIHIDPKKRIDAQTLVVRLHQIVDSHKPQPMAPPSSRPAASSAQKPESPALSLEERLHKIEKNLSTLKKWVTENLIETAQPTEKTCNPNFIQEQQLRLIRSILGLTPRETSSSSASTSSSSKDSAVTESIPVQRNRDYWPTSHSTREKPKPKTVEWDKMQFRAGVTTEGQLSVGMQVPVHLGTYGMNAGVDIQTDSQALKDLWDVLRGVKLHPQSKTFPTDHGDYKIKWYTMGHSILSHRDNKDFKVKIQGPDGKKHTLWVKGLMQLEGKVNKYLQQLIARKSSQELNHFSQSFEELIKQRQIETAQSLLDNFRKSYGQNFSVLLLQQYQLFLNENAARQRVENLQQESISKIIAQLKTVARAGMLGAADYLEQELLITLLKAKLLDASSEGELKAAANALTEVKKGSYVNPPDLNEKVDFPIKEWFKKEGKHWRGEIRQRALDRRNEIIQAYKELQAAARAGKGVAEAEKKLKELYQKAETGGKHGFGIRFVDGTTWGDWFKQKYPDIVECAEGKSTWLNNYNKPSEAHAQPVLNEQEQRSLSIAINIHNYNQATQELGDANATPDQRKIAFKARYEAAKNLQERNLQKEDLEGGRDPNFIKIVIEHYDWCDGSLVCSEAAGTIDILLKRYVKEVDGKQNIHIHQMTESDRGEMRKQAEIITQSAKKESEIYKYAHEALCYNYQILADSYGKFGSLFLTQTFTDYAQQHGYAKLVAASRLLNICFPTLVQDTLILSWAHLQGNTSAGLSNLFKNMNNTLPQFQELKKSKINLLDTAWNMTTAVLPLILDPQQEGNRGFYQGVQLFSGTISRVQNYLQGTYKTPLLSAAPFDLYEFLVEQPEPPKGLGQATWIDSCKSYVHQTLQQVMPNFLQPGHLPENQIYYAVKHLAANVGSAYTVIQAGRRMTGSHGDDRDVKAGVLFASAMTLMQAWQGKFSEECASAMLKNAQYYLEHAMFFEAHASILSLQEYLKGRAPGSDKETAWMKMELFCLEANFICIYQIAAQYAQQQNWTAAEPYFKQLEAFVNTGFGSVNTRLKEILGDKKWIPVHQQALEVQQKLPARNLNALTLLLNFSVNQSHIFTEEEVAVKEAELQKRLEEALKSYSKVQVKIQGRTIQLTGIVDSEKDLTDIPVLVLSLQSAYVVEDHLQLSQDNVQFS